jgi:hypothetical protein
MEMKMKKFILPFLLLLFTFTASAQTQNNEVQNEKCCEIIVQTITGTTDTAEKSDLPKNLANIEKNLKSIFSFSSYKLSSTHFFRSSSNFEYKGFFAQSKNYSSVVEMTLSELKQTKNGYYFNNFRFGLLLLSSMDNDSKYRGQTGFTVKDFLISQNTPTIIGSVSLPVKTQNYDEMIFIILTVKPAD